MARAQRSCGIAAELHSGSGRRGRCATLRGSFHSGGCAHRQLPAPCAAPQELRRGADPAHIYSLALSRHCEWLALSSSRGTVHVFALAPAVHTTPAGTPALHS